MAATFEVKIGADMHGEKFEKITPLIMCGGAGARLWPASREAQPKQFLKLFGRHSTFQATLLRVTGAPLFARPVVITNKAHRFIVREQAAEVGADVDILLEPCRRDSGPAMCAGTIFVTRRDGDALLLALAADHVVTDSTGFVDSCRRALPAASAGHIVTFGVKPTHASSEYGYIRPGQDLTCDVRQVEKFVEKPPTDAAAAYMGQGYLWNSGNLLFEGRSLLQEYAAADAEAIERLTEAVDRAVDDLGFTVLDEASFAQVAPTSIDYAVMEHTSRAAVTELRSDWSDVGSWHAIWKLSDKDEDQNAARGPALFENSHRCNVVTDKALVALEGVDDLSVVATTDAILISRQQDAGALKRVVARLRQTNPELTEEHLRVHRPWGSYSSLDKGERHQVKKIVVVPGARLSLQRHHHRSEHWIIVRGVARVTIGDVVRVVHENESIYVPLGAVHRLENPGKIPLELIEVQTGSYLGEDDIVRIDDDYRRA